ncbi:MAG: ABC transporter substrate-binding protein [Rhodobacter sp.]|jgi:ABC-type nitrate/sulfonate/bicarbonate transport system substrate-binding protein|nr:ABC transporter substrate-binding protein [Rhodobacter sp.]MCA3487776.1 ABC transporter substrate-binding protein [Rhodobacter sp.]MCA3494217.1 ABC transporter substrate-binding protein [Rhodobacter sp.]MCA3499605.1 ABC transporter substrate-binding protein [Rhodobacter sp.]MCA3503130.1 ABC transporter substrate-binding protein [Rhodobacter sp.]
MPLTIGRRGFLQGTAMAGTALALPYAAWAATPFTMQAAWINDAEFAGYFLGMDKGYYAEEGLDLTYLPGGPDVIPESTLIAGRADLALTTPDTTIRAITEQGAKFKIIGAQYQKNPIGVVSLKKNPINAPADLVGKTIAVPPVNIVTIEALLALNGIDKAQVQIVPYAYDPTPLVKGEIDASLDFTTNVPFTISQLGEEAHSFLLYDHGVTLYNDTVVVTEETLASKRKELLAWLRASRKGWIEALADPALYPPQWETTWFAGTGRSIENEVYFNTAQKPLIEAPGGIFSMTEEDIEKNIRALAAVGITGTREMFDTTLLSEI